LGELTRDHPKPLLTVGDAPFLDELIWRLARFKFRRLLLLAGYKADKFTDYLAQRARDLAIDIKLVVEPQPLGTAGALRFAADKLDPTFYLLNGDSLFDFNWLDLVPFAAAHSPLIAMALRHEPDASRFGVVEIDGERVVGFRERGGPAGGTINGGVYLVSRDIVPFLPESGSLERDVLPGLSARGRVCGRVYDGFFIDIGTPASFVQAPALLRANRQRPAVFMDRDGVLNADHGYVHRIDRFDWLPGAIKAVKLINDSGRYVFLVTNQAGVARGYYPESQVGALHHHIQLVLRANGAHFDDIRYCPYHPESEIPAYKHASNWRKPEPGMILDIMAHWPIDAAHSLLIGDKASDIDAATHAGIEGHLFTGGNLFDFVSPIIR
jgi:D-glycero-D-manno-heptose 1,7-bisphosphate phosphatase